MSAAHIRVQCHSCQKEVYAAPLEMLLVLDDGTATYTFECSTCGWQSQDAHKWVEEQLKASGVPICELPVRDAADILAAAMCDDQEIADEVDGWEPWS